MIILKRGNKVGNGMALCANCSSPMPWQAPQPQAPQSKRRRRWPIVVATHFVTVAFAAMVAFVALPSMQPKGVWVVTKEVTTTQDTDGEKTTTRTYTIDGKGNLLTQAVDSSNNGYDSSSLYEFSYDEQGFCKSETSKSFDKPKSSSNSSNTTYKRNYSYQWTFDNGKPTQLVRSTTINDKARLDTCSYDYNDDGHISKKIDINKSVSNEYEEVSEFDERGLAVRHTFDGADISNETVFDYEFDASGKPTKLSSVTTDKTSGHKTQEGTTTYEYDENGNAKSARSEYIEYSYGDSNPIKSSITTTYEYTYVEDPSPWVAQVARLYAVHSSYPY